MKAIYYTQYGSPDVLRLEEVEKPTPKDDEVLIRVHAASLNAYDWHILRADPFLARLGKGLFGPTNKIPGADVAGVVEAVGKNVTQYRLGDAVYGPAGTRLHPVAQRLGRHALHAASLAFPHPDDGRRMSFEAPLPPELQQALEELRAP